MRCFSTALIHEIWFADKLIKCSLLKIFILWVWKKKCVYMLTVIVTMHLIGIVWNAGKRDWERHSFTLLENFILENTWCFGKSGKFNRKKILFSGSTVPRDTKNDLVVSRDFSAVCIPQSYFNLLSYRLKHMLFTLCIFTVPSKWESQSIFQTWLN